MKKTKEDCGDYQNTRFKFDSKRKIVWQEIARYLRKWINPQGTAVELGSGYCDFINSIRADKKIAVDKNINPHRFCNPSIEAIFGDFRKISRIKDNSVDTFLASNFFEHLDKKEIKSCMKLIKKKLKTGGRIIIIQPNFKYAYKIYFDDYTHETIWTDESLKDFINSVGFKVIKVMPKFLPATMKSGLPKWRFLVRMYLNSLIKPFAGQMLIIARKI